MKFLLIEDDDYKADQIVQFLENQNHEIIVAKAYNTGMRKIVTQTYDIVLLDMTIPSFEISREHPTSRIRKYGGKDILFELDRREINIPIIVITQYQVFGDGEKTLDRLDQELKNEFPTLYKGYVYYNSSALDWQENLIEKIREE